MTTLDDSNDDVGHTMCTVATCHDFIALNRIEPETTHAQACAF